MLGRTATLGIFALLLRPPWQMISPIDKPIKATCSNLDGTVQKAMMNDGKKPKTQQAKNGKLGKKLFQSINRFHLLVQLSERCQKMMNPRDLSLRDTSWWYSLELLVFNHQSISKYINLRWVALVYCEISEFYNVLPSEVLFRSQRAGCLAAHRQDDGCPRRSLPYSDHSAQRCRQRWGGGTWTTVWPCNIWLFLGNKLWMVANNDL